MATTFDIYYSIQPNDEVSYWSTLELETVAEALEYARGLSLEWRGLCFYVANAPGFARYGTITRDFGSED